MKDFNKKINITHKCKFIKINSFSIEDAFYKPCIYYLTAGKSIVYIGETTSIMNRIGQHLKENVKIFDGVKLIWFNGTKQERLIKEKNEISFHNPHYNIIHKKWQVEQLPKKINKKQKMLTLLNKIATNLNENKR